MTAVRTILDRIHTHRAGILSWLIIAVTGVLGYVSYIRNAGLFFPDSRYYLAMALWFSGDSQEVAHARTEDFSANWDFPMPDIESTFGWGLVQPRVVLPLLSAPFVRLFGPYGLAVVPALTMIAFTIVLAILVMRRYGRVAGVATVVLMNASYTLMWTMTGMLTESLSALWSLLALVLAWRYMRKPRVLLLVAIAVVTLLSAFTRQATFIMAGAFVMAWLLDMILHRRGRSPWMAPALVVGASSLGAQIAQSIIFPSFSQADQFIRMTGADSLGGAILEIPRLARHIFVSDVNSLMVADVPLLFILFLSLGAMILFWRRPEAHLLFGAILGVALYNITNGTPTGFRYAVPGLVFYLLPIALMFRRTAETREKTERVEEPAVLA